MATPTTQDHLSSLDAAFLAVETATAHMHVGWAATAAARSGRRPPSFEQLRDHIESRLGRAPRYRQRLAEVPLGLGNPVWVDDESFDIARHVRAAPSGDFSAVVDAVMSRPLEPGRPLWELWICDALPGGRLGVVAKVHHCMVDGLGAVELGALLFDTTPDTPRSANGRWQPHPPPSGQRLLAAKLGRRARSAAELGLAPARLARAPRRLPGLPLRGAKALRALARAARPTTGAGGLNERLSARRRLVGVTRPLEDLARIRRRFDATLNDVVLAAAAGGLRRFAQHRGEPVRSLKTMVPVSVRDQGSPHELGNRVSCVFVDLPCDEPDPGRRLERIHEAMAGSKASGEPEAGTRLLGVLEYAPRQLQAAASRLVAGPRVFNLTVSNIPGPSEPLYMLGCELERAFPVVPLPDGHRVSIGMISVGDQACFGIYADGKLASEADALAAGIDAALDELLALSP